MTVLDPNAIIAEAKLTKYLLIPLAKDDKSQFLAQAGYRLENWQQLQQDLREQILPLEAILTALTQYGQKYAITGNIISPNGRTIRIKTIWMVTEPRLTQSEGVILNETKCREGSQSTLETEMLPCALLHSA